MLTKPVRKPKVTHFGRLAESKLVQEGPIEMKRVETTQDRSRGTLTYQLDDGRYVTLDANAVGLYGAENLVQWLGLKRIPVMQHGRRVGTLPTDAELLDGLRREGDAWTADEKLELDNVKEFEREVNA